MTCNFLRFEYSSRAMTEIAIAFWQHALRALASMVTLADDVECPPSWGASARPGFSNTFSKEAP
eukprot:3375058-Alexandrium_andersonii.AAC.1